MESLKKDTISPRHPDITIQTVYELASEIGEQFKQFINQYGQEPNQRLITAVVQVLEYLEDALLQKEDYLLLVDKLQIQIEELQRGQLERTQQQMRYLSEIEDIDESWRKENIQLSQYVKFLRNENQKLASSLNEQFSHSLTDLKLHDDEDQHMNCTTVKRQHQPSISQMEKLQRRISILCQEVESKQAEIGNLQTRNTSLLDENKQLRELVSLMNNCVTEPSAEDTLTQTSAEPMKDNTNNELLLRIRQLEDQLEVYKLKKKLEHVYWIDNDANNNTENTTSTGLIEEAQEVREQEEDLPVQGPIPKEPDEKLLYYRGQRKSRIWSFFPRFTRAWIK